MCACLLRVVVMQYGVLISMVCAWQLFVNQRWGCSAEREFNTAMFGICVRLVLRHSYSETYSVAKTRSIF